MISTDILLNNETVVESAGEFNKKYSISTDSRTITPSDIFVALSGDKFRGIDFIPQCVEKGVGAFVLSNDKRSRALVKKIKSKKRHNISVIYVTDTLLYLQEVARKHLQQWKTCGGQAIAITGSNGKTTTKEMLFHLIKYAVSTPASVLCTAANFNNHIGLPLTVLSLLPSHQWAILEMGTNHPGELHLLCSVAPADHGFITNIGDSHLQFFGDRRGVFKEKKVLYDSIVQNNGVFVINQDDQYLKTMGVADRTVSYGFYGEDVRVEIDNNKMTLFVKEGVLEVVNKNIKSRISYFNMGMCMTLCLRLFPDKKDKIIAAASTFNPPKNNRMNWIELSNNRKVFLDAYNANPTSMQISLESFLETVIDDGECLYILGDMNELGDRALDMHYNIGKWLCKQINGEVVFIGRYAQSYCDGLGRDAKCYDDLASFMRHWPEYLDKYRVFFIKGSRALQLEKLLDAVDK